MKKEIKKDLTPKVKKKSKYKVGDVIKFKREVKRELANRFNDIRFLDSEIERLSISTRKKERLLWDFIYEVNPDIKEFELSYNYKNQTIMIKKIDNE